MKMSEEVFGGSRGVTDPRQACRVRDPMVRDHKKIMQKMKVQAQIRDARLQKALSERNGSCSPVYSSFFVGYKRQRGGGTNSRLNAACSGGGRGGGDGSVAASVDLVGGAQKRSGEE
ncbi:unnamed protein product [Brassica rapa]|nr:unnamed protein product [Brassica rapa]VDC87992.1 unnamed protein product [Brassica rapa]